MVKKMGLIGQRCPSHPLEDPKEWVRWQAHHVETLAWWPELAMVPTPRDAIRFTKHLQASFQFPKVMYLWDEQNNYTLLPAPHWIEWDVFLPQAEGDFASKDYQLRQPKKTLVLAKALQFWAEEAQPSWANKPWQLAECIRELREEMKPMTTFTAEDVLNNEPPSPWKKITSSRGAKGEEEELWKAIRAWGRGKMQRALIPGFLLGHPFSRMFQAHHCPINDGSSNHLHPCYTQLANCFCMSIDTPWWTSRKNPAWLSGFEEIAQPLREGNAPKTMVNFPQERTSAWSLLVGAAMMITMSMWLWQEARSDITYIDSVTASMSLTSLGSAPIMVDHPRATLEDVTDVEDWRPFLPLPLDVISTNCHTHVKLCSRSHYNPRVTAISGILYRIVISLNLFISIIVVNVISPLLVLWILCTQFAKIVFSLTAKAI